MACLLALFLLAASLVAVSGCGGDKEAADTAEDSTGEVVAGTEGGEVAANPEEAAEESVDASQGDVPEEAQVGEGEVSYQIYHEAPSEGELGAPVYPGASYVPSSGGSVTGTGPEGDYTTVGGEFHTGDGFQQVLAWYRERLGEPLLVEASQSTATWSRREGDRMVVVGLRGEASGTTISIYNLQGSEELFP